jgi:hypothetical protein
MKPIANEGLYLTAELLENYSNEKRILVTFMYFVSCQDFKRKYLLMFAFFFFRHGMIVYRESTRYLKDILWTKYGK